MNTEKKIVPSIAWPNLLNENDKLELQHYHRKYTELFTEHMYNLRNLLSKEKLEQILTQLNETIIEKTPSDRVSTFISIMSGNIFSYAETHFHSDFFPFEFILSYST